MTITADSFVLPFNATEAQIFALNQALAYLQTSSTGTQILQSVADIRPKIIFTTGDNKADPSANPKEIEWNPFSNTWDYQERQGNGVDTGFAGIKSAAVSFIHEAYHLIDPLSPLDQIILLPNYDNLQEYLAGCASA